MQDLLERDVRELLDQLQAREVRATELLQACLEQIDRYDSRIGAFLRVNRESALAQAETIDRRREKGQPVGRLAGVPVAIKDNLCTQGEPTSCASRMLADFRPPYDATVIARLKEADAILLGRTNLDEFAMGGSTETSAFQKTCNPWDLERIPGGSSGGSAASVAARMTPLAVGTDTGGSIRQPAALCNVVGLKPTYGRVSRYGLVAFASSLDQIGPLARSVEGAALLLEVLAGHDPKDSTSVPRPVPTYSARLGQPLEGLRIGIVPEHFTEGLDEEVSQAVRQAVGVYRTLGATIREIHLPHSQYAVATYYIIAPSEASSNLTRYDGVHFGYRTDQRAMMAQWEAEAALRRADNQAIAEALDTPLVRMFRQTRSEGFGPEVQRRIMLGTYALSAGYYEAYYLKALKVRRLIRQDFDEAFGEVDLILGPVTPSPAFRLGERIDDPLAMYLFDLYTAVTNLAGICGMSIPCGFSRQGLPIGLHLQAPAFEEERLLRAGAMFQRVTDWHRRRPPLGKM